MKKYIVCAAVCAAALFCASAASQDEIETYRRLYSLMSTWEERLALLENIGDSADGDFGDFLGTVLDQLVAEARVQPNQAETAAWNECITYTAKRVGETRYEQAADDLWRLYQIATSADAKSETLIALGQIGADAYLERIILELDYLNADVNRDKNYTETIVRGAVISLEKYADPSAYRGVFIAANGGYSAELRAQANDSLDVICPEPGEQLLALAGDNSLPVSVIAAAVNAGVERSSSNEEKARFCARALETMRSLRLTDGEAKNEKRKLENYILSTLCSIEDHSDELVPLLKYMTTDRETQTERAFVIQTLGVNGTDEAVEVLSAMLREINSRRISGPYRREENTYVRALISALGDTGNTNAQSALTEVTAISSYTNSIVRLAKENLIALQSAR